MQLMTIFPTNFIFFPSFFLVILFVTVPRKKMYVNQHPRGLKNKMSTDSVLKYDLKYLNFGLRFAILTCALGYFINHASHFSLLLL